MAILTVGIDLAKNVFALHGVNESGKPELLRPAVARAKFNEVVAALPPCTIGMEACSGAHYWARQFMVHGHTVRLMAPKLVTPYRMSGKRGKNDAADAAAIPELLRPTMVLLVEEVRLLEARIGALERELAALVRHSPACTTLLSVPGIGLLTSTAMVAATSGDVTHFKDARHSASWFGLTPKEHSSGQRRQLGGISKQGDRYLRMLLTHGARSVLRAAAAARNAGKPVQGLRAWALAVQDRSQPQQGLLRAGQQARAHRLCVPARSRGLQRENQAGQEDRTPELRDAQRGAARMRTSPAH